MRAHWIISIYSTLLALFPARYQEEYGEELLYAVRMYVEQAQSRGRLSILRLAWRELRDFPGACLRAHLRERRGSIMKLAPGAHLPEGPFKYWQQLPCSPSPFPAGRGFACFREGFTSLLRDWGGPAWTAGDVWISGW
jgi:hypothetical protein